MVVTLCGAITASGYSVIRNRPISVSHAIQYTQPTTMRHFVYLLWCPKGRFVYRTRAGRGGTATVWQLSRSLPQIDLANCWIHVLTRLIQPSSCHKTINWLIDWLIDPLTKSELYATLLLPNFKFHRHIKLIPVVTYNSSARRHDMYEWSQPRKQ